LRAGDFAKMSVQRTRMQRFHVFCEEILHHKRLNCAAKQLRITK
jgi:hypothetical protein